MPEAALPIPLDRLAALAIEHWRLTTALPPAQASAPVRHALRQIGDFLASCQLEVRSLDGLPYDPGLAARVVDTVADPALPPDTTVVCETLSPMVLHHGQVLRPAEVVIASARGRPLNA